MTAVLPDRPEHISLLISPSPPLPQFPSPSSSFLPPPSAHDFAMKPVPRGKRPANLDPDSEPEMESPVLGASPITPTPTDTPITPTNVPVTPTSAVPAPQTTPISAQIPPSTRASIGSTLSPAHASPTSSRVAPPSPAASRRASAALSRRSSARTNPRLSLLSNAPAPTPEAPPLIRIRDFAFPPGDVRHVGLGPDVPHASRAAVLARRLRRGSALSDSSSGTESDAGEDEGDGWGAAGGGIGWSGLGRLSWQFGARGHVPGDADFARNFADGAAEGTEEEEDGDDEGEEEEGEEGELLPGIYRALYAFEPEGTAEMALAEEQLVRVVGRGGGAGWAVVDTAGPAGGGTHALVPESYLELVTLDGA